VRQFPDPLRIWRGRFGPGAAETVIRIAVPVAYLALIFALSSVHGSDLPAVADDRIEHFSEYFGLGCALLVAVVAFRPLDHIGTVAGPAAFGALYAASDEFHQMFVPGRDSSLKDLAFDTLGVSTAAFLIYFLIRRRR
jgi:VanZ family protein